MHDPCRPYMKTTQRYFREEWPGVGVVYVLTTHAYPPFRRDFAYRVGWLPEESFLHSPVRQEFERDQVLEIWQLIREG